MLRFGIAICKWLLLILYLPMYSCTYLCLIVLQDKLEYQQETMQQDSNLEVTCTLHSERTLKLGFVDDSVIFNKLQGCYSAQLSVFINPFQHVKHINPSEVQKEFYYLSGHVIELLKCCHPELLIKWCENLMASGMQKINFLPSYSLYKLRKLKTSSAIIKMMRMFWSWSNHSILKSLSVVSRSVNLIIYNQL